VTPALDVDKPCANSNECSMRWCVCPGSPYAPHNLEDGANAAGTCARFPAPGGAGWLCTIESGRIKRHGMIVD
jgi:hypothetical protein